MSHDKGKRCLCVSDHRPPVLEFIEHHIWPEFMGGPDTEDNLVWLCPTTHYNVHEILRSLVKGGRLTYWKVRAFQLAPVNRYAYQIALDGFDRWKAGNSV